jgi:hypothetical protein
MVNQNHGVWFAIPARVVAKQYMSKNTALAAKISAVSMMVDGNALWDLSLKAVSDNKQCRTHCRHREAGCASQDRQQEGCHRWGHRT